MWEKKNSRWLQGCEGGEGKREGREGKEGGVGCMWGWCTMSKSQMSVRSTIPICLLFCVGIFCIHVCIVVMELPTYNVWLYLLPSPINLMGCIGERAFPRWTHSVHERDSAPLPPTHLLSQHSQEGHHCPLCTVCSLSQFVFKMVSTWRNMSNIENHLWLCASYVISYDKSQIMQLWNVSSACNNLISNYIFSLSKVQPTEEKCWTMARC